MAEDMRKAFPPSLPQLLIEDAVRAALLEDLGRAGDITTNATLPEDAVASAVLSSRDAGTICGMDFARTAFELMDPRAEIHYAGQGWCKGQAGRGHCAHRRQCPCHSLCRTRRAQFPHASERHCKLYRKIR